MPRKCRNRNAVWLLAGIAAVAQSQTKPTIKQSSANSPCSNIVALAGNAEISCSSLTTEQQKKLDQIPGILKKILANQIDISKLNELLKAAAQTPSNEGSIFQQNSGGVNIQQGTTGPGSPIVNSPITVGHVPKSISPENMTGLVNFLKTAQIKSKILVEADQVSGVAPFPDDFYRALKLAKWDMTAPGVSGEMTVYAPGPKLQGAEIHMKGEPLKPDEPVYFQPGDPLAYIARALDAFGVPRVLIRDQKQEDGVITIEFVQGFADQ